MKLSRKHFINAGIFLAIVLGLIFPASDWLKKTLPYILGFLLLSNFIGIDLHIKKFMRRELLYFPVIAFLILPFLVFYSTLLFPIDLRLGIFIIAITPSAIASPVVVNLIDGDRELSVSHVIFSNLLSPFAYTLLLYFFFRTESVSIPVLSLLRDIGLLIILPFMLSRIIRFNRNVCTVSKKIFSVMGPVGFLLVIFVAVASSSLQLRSMQKSFLIMIFIVSAVIAAISFSIGFFLSRESKIRRTLSVGFGHKNTSLAVWIGLSNFNGIVVLPVVAYIVFHHIINGILVSRYHR
jgi:BASS family bile acid:Na+ symporter